MRLVPDRIHRQIGDLDTALAAARRLRPAQLPTAERRARAATDKSPLP
ncbi:hypothetical protein [Streptomyces sp. NPDC002962]